MHSFPAASVATAAARAATLRPEAAVGGSSSSAGTESEPRYLPLRFLPPLPRSLPPCVARFPPPAAGGCDVPRSLPPPPLTDGLGAPPAPGTDPVARGRASKVKPPPRCRQAGRPGPGGSLWVAAAPSFPGGARWAGVPGWVG